MAYEDYNDEGRERDESNPLDKDWIPDEALDALTSERAVHPEEKPEQTARRLLLENLGQVTLGIIHTAIYGSSERIRLDAQKYVMERVLGRIGDDAYGAEVSPIEAFLAEVTAYAKKAASVGGE